MQTKLHIEESMVWRKIDKYNNKIHLFNVFKNQNFNSCFVTWWNLPVTLKRFNFVNSPVWQVGLSPWGNSRVTRDRASSPPESTRNTLITHCTYLRFLSRLLHKRYEDGSTGGQQRWRRDTTGYRVNVNIGHHDDLRASIHRCFDYRRHRSFESDARDDQMPPRDPEDVPWGTWTPGLDI